MTQGTGQGFGERQEVLCRSKVILGKVHLRHSHILY
jgi:hypothetical protein